MKLLTKDTDYAIRALVCIAGKGKNLVTVTLLAEELYIPKAFLRKILQMLNKKGFLSSYKGKSGGFTLARSVVDITILDVAEVFQGPFRLKEHDYKGKECPFLDGCLLKTRIDEIEKYIMNELRSISIQSLITEKRRDDKTENNKDR